MLFFSVKSSETYVFNIWFNFCSDHWEILNIGSFFMYLFSLRQSFNIRLSRVDDGGYSGTLRSYVTKRR